MDKKRLAINMAAQLLAFAVNMGISFFLAPIIEAQMANTYGFVTLANQFVLYAQIVVSALNTMASRFVTIHIHRGEERIFLLCIFRKCDHGWHFPAAGAGDRDLYGELAVPACSGGCSA